MLKQLLARLGRKLRRRRVKVGDRVTSSFRNGEIGTVESLIVDRTTGAKTALVRFPRSALYRESAVWISASRLERV